MTHVLAHAALDVALTVTINATAHAKAHALIPVVVDAAQAATVVSLTFNMMRRLFSPYSSHHAFVP